jgi:dihydropteroate synthase
MIWRCREREFPLEHTTLIMGVVNVTPDSFSDGGRHLDPEAAIAQALRLAAEGADIVDLGAESTRPGSRPVEPLVQLERLVPVLEGLNDRGLCLSVDTSSATVAERAIALGAAVVNDVTALGDPAMAPLVASSGAGVVLMHARGTPATMQDDPRYDDVAREVAAWLEGRVERARAAGIAAEQIAIDPGIGFGKTARHNLELLSRLDELGRRDRPVLVGASRKGFLGAIGGTGVDERLEGGLGVAAIAVFLGARIVRTHDVAATASAVRLATALREARRVDANV